MKKRSRLVGSAIAVIGMGYTATFAADSSSCATCSTTSPILEQYINFSHELISTLKTIANEKKQSANQSSSAKTPEAQVLQNIVNNLNEKGQTALTFSVLVKSIGTQLVASSTRQELQVMTNSKALMRDRQKLDDLDQSIADTLFELGQAGVFIANVSGYKQRIDNIFTTYAKQSPAFLQVSGDPSSSASTLITALWDLNQAYKRFIASDNTDGFDAFSEKYRDTLGVTLTDVNYNELSQEYACTRGINKCDATYQKFGENMSSISKGAQKETKKAVDTIKTALARLKCAFAKQNDIKCQQAGFTTYQNNLLRGLYGIEGPMANKQGSSALANSMQRIGDALASQVNDLKDFYTKNTNAKSYVAVPKTAPLDINSPDIATQNNSDNLYTNLMNTVNDTLAKSKSTRQQYVFADPKVVTRNIPAVSILVHSSITIIGDPNTRKSLTQNLGKACENQCSNLGGTCYY